jgi:pimeloyl-ACP methyl ester carboxylesterase
MRQPAVATAPVVPRTETVVVSGGRVPVAVADEWVSHLPGARRHVVEGAGQMPLVDRPEESVDVVRTFLQPAQIVPGR